MQDFQKHRIRYLLLLVIAVFLFALDISLGSVTIPFQEVLTSLTGGKASKETWEYIIINYRLPKAITAILVGIGLSVSGMLMQTLFRNPLAGPYVLGLSAGSSLGVALVVLGSGFLPAICADYLVSSYGIIVVSCIGSAVVLLAILLISQRLRDTMVILIVGLMFGSFTNAFVGVLSYFSSAEQLQKYTFWSMGNLGNLSWTSVLILAIAIIVGMVLSFVSIKPLDALLLGESYAKSLGVNFKKSRLIIILATCILAGSITAFAGPIAFIGLAVPHMAKLIFQTSNHKVLFWSTSLIGISIMLFCDMISQVPGSDFTLPINAITSIIGAPVVVWLLVRKRKMMY